MNRVIGRVLGVGTALAFLAVTVATAAAPEGPRLAFVKWGPGPYTLSLATVNARGAEAQTLLRGFRRTRPALFPFEEPTWSSDGSLIAFAGFTGRIYDNGSKIFLLDVAGGTPRAIPGTEGGRAPVLSPDGTTVAFARIRERERVVRRPGEIREIVERNASTWLVGLDGGPPRRLTSQRFGVEHFPSSFSPDGHLLAATRSLRRGPPAVVGLALDENPSRLIVRNAAGGTFSPDGTRIAYLAHGRKYTEKDGDGGGATGRTTDLFVRSLEGSGSVRLTHTPKMAELGASWDPSGERLAFVQLGTNLSFFETLGVGNAIVQINADGTCREEMLSFRKAALFGAAWQPGPGRGAGRISC